MQTGVLANFLLYFCFIFNRRNWSCFYLFSAFVSAATTLTLNNTIYIRVALFASLSYSYFD
jgi:hypothetical protein